MGSGLARARSNLDRARANPEPICTLSRVTAAKQTSRLLYTVFVVVDVRNANELSVHIVLDQFDLVRWEFWRLWIVDQCASFMPAANGYNLFEQRWYFLQFFRQDARLDGALGIYFADFQGILSPEKLGMYYFPVLSQYLPCFRSGRTSPYYWVGACVS